MKLFRYTLCLASFLLLLSCTQGNKTNGKSYTLAAYYFPNYHVDARNEKNFGEGWTEWELIRNAIPRFPGHYQPRVPAWGYTHDDDPVDMAQKIDAAADHGIDVFIFDWYYYDDGLFLERGLEEGFMKASNNDRMKFSLMWANHDYFDIFPSKGLPLPQNELLFPGAITPQTWEEMTSYIVETYFKNPSYWLIDGAPYFSVYDLTKLLESFGSIDATKDALDRFRQKTLKAGFNDLHLNLVYWGSPELPGGETVENMHLLASMLGFESITSYVWIHHVPLKEFPLIPFETLQEDYFAYANNALTKFNLPYFPNVTVGWDSSPRCDPGLPWDQIGYPYMSVIEGDPDKFKRSLQKVKKFLNDNPQTKGILTINCWNEWSEGSYLEPDMVHGLGYLEAIKQVFKDN